MKKNVNRRDFLKSSTILGAGSVGAGMVSMNSCDSEKGELPKLSYVSPPEDFTLLQNLENDFFKVQIFSNGALKVLDKINNQKWTTYAVAIQDEKEIRESMLWGRDGRALGEQYPGRFIGSKDGNRLKFIVYGRENVNKGSFICEFKSDGEWLSFQIHEVDESLPSLIFPPPFKCETLVLPTNGGQLYRNTASSIYRGMYDRQFLQFFNSLGMRFIAGLEGENGWLCAYHTDSVDAGAMRINHHITPAWLKSMGKWQGHYQCYYSFTGNNYVGIAKRYRQYAIRNGYFRSLKEKIDANPEAEKLLGGRALQFMNYFSKGHDEVQENYWHTDEQVESYKKEYINFTFKDVMDKVKMAEDMLGFKKGMVLLRGWMNKGYDASHPDIFPIESKLGTEAEFKEVLNLKDKYVTVLHDNYQDFYPTTPSFPKGVVVRSNGELMAAGVWFGKQCYMFNSRDSVKYAKRNLMDILEAGPSGYYVDCVPNNPFHESYEKGNEQTRREDMQNKLGILKVFHDANLVTGSERFGDFCVPTMHWLEHSQRRIEGESVPIWQLVYHDAVFTCSYNTFSRRSPYPSWLEDMIYGNFLRFWVPLNFGTGKEYEFNWTTGWGGGQFTEEEFKNTYHVDEWHKKIGLEEMISHRFVTDDNKVEEAIYGRYKITVNFDDRERTVSGKVVKPHSYILEG